MSLLVYRKTPPRTIVFNWGCPRSGTTYLERWLEQVPNLFTVKLHEGHPHHPCNSSDGLLKLARLFRYERPIFIRIVRNPVEVFRSFHTARLIQGRVDRIARNTDERIFKFIEREYTNFGAQKGEITYVCVDYDSLHDLGYQKSISRQIANKLPNRDATYNALLAHVGGTFGKNPVRVGALSEGTKAVLSPELIKEIERRISNIIG